MDDKLLWGIRLARALSEDDEVTAFFLLLRMQDVRPMLRLNSALGLVGPLIFVAVSAMGLAEGLGRIHPQKLLLILLGVILVILGTRP